MGFGILFLEVVLDTLRLVLIVDNSLFNLSLSFSKTETLSLNILSALLRGSIESSVYLPWMLVIIESSLLFSLSIGLLVLHYEVISNLINTSYLHLTL